MERHDGVKCRMCGLPLSEDDMAADLPQFAGEVHRDCYEEYASEYAEYLKSEAGEPCWPDRGM